MNEDRGFPGGVTLVGPFDPATIAGLMTPEAAAQIKAIKSAPGVPIHRLAASLTARGISTTLLGGVRGAMPLHIKSNLLSVTIYPRRGGWPFLLNGLHRERNAILAHLQEIQPSMVHAHWTFEAGRAVGDWNGPKLLTIHDAAWEYARLGWAPRPVSVAFTARWLANTSATLARFRHVIAVSPFVETYLRLKHRFQGEIRVIPNAIPDLPARLVPPVSFPKSGIVTFACYGEPGGLKNVHVAVKAFCKLEQRLHGARLLIFGKGWDKAKAELSNYRIEFRGSLPHHDFLKCMVEEVDIWVHPSRIEAHPISICEALQAGCPVIAGRQSGGVAWTLDYGHAGVLVDIENADEIAQAMYRVASDSAWVAGMVAYGRQMVRDRFNPKLVIDLHLEYYRDIMRS